MTASTEGIPYTLSCGCEGVHQPGGRGHHHHPSVGSFRYCAEHKHQHVTEVMPLPHPVRREPPELEFPPPDCPMCGGDLENDGDGWYCHHCEASWPSNGMGGSYNEPLARACQSVIEPFNREGLSPEHENIRHNREQCIKPAGHEGSHASGPWSTDMWDDGDPRIVHPANREDEE